jgi:hypothetical protein
LQQLISDTHFHAERRGERERESMNMAWGTSDPPYLMILQWKLLLLCINFVLVASLHIKEKETMDNYRCIPDVHRHPQISAPTIKISLKSTFYIKNSFRTWLNKTSYSNQGRVAFFYILYCWEFIFCDRRKYTECNNSVCDLWYRLPIH